MIKNRVGGRKIIYNFLMENNFLEHIPPNELCSKCGECCRCIISAYSEKELEELDDEEAKLFLSFFKKYNSISELDDKKKKYIEAVSSFMKKEVEIWYCPHIDEQNRCTIYEDRPSFCRSYPKNGWIVTPPGCGYKGWQYEQREKQKKIIRKLKEQLLILKTNASNNFQDDIIIVKELEEKILEKIAKYKKYGADNW